MSSLKADIPLCVDLDGTLLNADLPVETVLMLIRKNPFYIFMLLFWLLRGMPYAKTEVAKRVAVDAAALPYNQVFLDWLKEEKAAGRPLYLCTGSPWLIAETIAAHLGIFDGVMATGTDKNLTGKNKAAVLVEKFGDKSFDYCGNEAKDIAVWRHSRAAVVVNAGPALEKRAAAVTQISRVFPSRPARGWPMLLKAMRPQQWAKNLLVFVPLITAHRVADMEAARSAAIAFSAFCFCASSVYLLNDMLDIEADRRHPQKSARPFAAGALSLPLGILALAGLLGVAAFLAQALPHDFRLALAGYYLLTVLYSFRFKNIAVVDTLCLACLYTARIIAGAAAVGVPLSFWLLLFSVFFFLSLAWVKRCTELIAVKEMPHRGYRAADLPVLKVFGIASGYLSVLVLAFYIDSTAVTALYSRPQMIWLLCLLVFFWISRVWLKTHRGEMHYDPVVFALKDKTSYIVGSLAALALLAAI